jgi:branched-chain amino acid transport system substrate-binding protein
MTLPRDDNDFDGVDPGTRAPPLESLSTDPVEKPEAGNLHAWFWFDGRGREALSDSTSRPSSTGAPTMISRAILLAAIAIISIVAYFAGSGAFKSYSTELLGFFSQRTARAPASLPKEEAPATAATSSDHDQVSAPIDLSRSPERPVVDTQTQASVTAGKSIAAPQTSASLRQNALTTAATNSGRDQVPAPNDLSRSPDRTAVDTQTQTPDAAVKSSAVPQTSASLPKEEDALATAATNSDHDQVSASNDLSRPPARPAADTQTQAPLGAAKSSAAPPSGLAAALSPGSSESLPAAALANPGVPAPAAVGDVSPRQSDGTESTVQGVSAKEILFGMAAPFSGASRELGRQIKIGVETAFSQMNSAGGVNGRLLRLVAADDGYEPEKTPDAMRLLYDKEKVFGFIGNVGTPTAAVALPFALDHRALFFGAFTGASLLRRNPPDRYVFNYRASYGEETKAVVHYLVKVRHIQPKEIVVFAQQDSYGDSGYAGVQKAVRSLPGDNPDTVRLNYKRNTIDVQGAVDWLRAYKGPQIKAVVMIASYRAAAKFIEKTRDLYPWMIYTNVSFVGSTALADELMLLGPRYASGVIVTQVVPAINSYATVVLKYKEELANYFPGESPDYVSFEGYIDASILAEALKRVGPDINTEKLVEELERMHDFDLGLGAPITFSPNDHQGSHKVSGTELDESGHYQPIDLE